MDASIKIVVPPCIPKSKLFKISPVKILPSLILSLILIGLWSCSDAGKDPLSAGDDSACTEELDCNDVCGGTAVKDDCGVCGGDGSTCNISYSATIQPIFNGQCTGCHGSSGGLALDSYGSLMASSTVTAGDGAGSLLVQKLRGTASGAQMPKNAAALSESTINLIETWIDEGALEN
ncbi:MAG: c-type cytochrome domain-containing protein [Candidatus Marinimicrobia bacterium]|jgi:hypothetical protein|nr:c-type cytochrome domain-containing protein [Candidatus Neomarinimicrobiota bacterium]